MFSTIQPADKPVEMRAHLDRAIFALSFGSFGPLAFFAPKGLWIPILLLLLAQSKTLASVTPSDYRRILGQSAFYLVLPLYAVLSAAWAVVPENAAITGAKLFGYILAAVAIVIVVDRLSDSEKRSVLYCAAVGLIIADLVVWVELGTAGALSGLIKQGPFTANQFSRGAAISACAALPIAVGLFRLSGPRLTCVFAVICLVTILVLENEAAMLAAVLGILVYMAVRWRPVLFWPVVLLPLAVGIVSPIFFSIGLSASQLCALYNIKESAAHRVKIYEFSSQKAFEKPLFGWGMDASRSVPGGGDEVELSGCRYQGGRSTFRSIGGLVPLHPHNGSLQVWLELGVVGVAIFMGLLGSLILRLQRAYSTSDGRPLIAGLLTAIFLIYNISFGLWQGWLIFALILLCAVLRALRLGGAEPTGAIGG